MPRISSERVRELARMSGLGVDVSRSDAVATRLSSVLDELDAIDAEALAGVEPAPVFMPVKSEHPGDG